MRCLLLRIVVVAGVGAAGVAVGVDAVAPAWEGLGTVAGAVAAGAGRSLDRNPLGFQLQSPGAHTKPPF